MSYLLDGIARAGELLASGDPETFSAVAATLEATALAMAAALALGLPAGFCLGYFRFPGKRALRTLSDAFMAFPTVVIGLLVYALLSRRGPFGEMGLLFTVPGMALGLALLALPMLVSLTASAVEQMDARLRLTLRTLGADNRQLLLGILWEARHGVMAGVVAAFGRVVSEVGIAMMVGGNIKWHTRTITTAIALETGKGEFAQGIALGMVLLAISMAVNGLLALLKRRGGAR
ncbi:Tungstate uptake system permease protein TupB [Fundidesulfovibrio magnetotacticus]|uniref:Tungstate uptake system permease protein TupB n=1 Tax=Fundidesulfovibrio magnetotacticus TaxID=2730080 RepID=A0A6V8M564_9BACT|nr:ABC transporter permease [Fundidesulfovibrio magnetotacticus]GFK95665.1 Tungstate uptake system permease protein TupB [Fundidesulfovibrio magnetotacticus]